MKKLIILIGLLSVILHIHCNKKTKEYVILLHGLARTENSMNKLEKSLKSRGYSVINNGYPSTEKKIQKLSLNTITAALKICDENNASKVHFVTHSLGGILVRYYLEYNQIENLGRVVMLSPPNKGSEVVDKLGDLKIFQWINGPAGLQLGTEEDSIPKSLGKPNFEVGIITGDRSINLILSLLIPGKDDGKVSIDNAQLAGMKDFIVVHKTHPMIMRSKSVHKEILFFLENGMFKPE